MTAIHPYSRVNEALNKVFFDGRFAGQPVYMSLDNDMRLELAERLALEPAEVEEAICQSVRRIFSTAGDPYARSANDMRMWRRSGMRTAPPFTAVLFCLSHAAALMAAEDDFAASNYYRRLIQITGLSRETLNAHRKSTDLFWKYLAEWLLLNNYALGKPTARAQSASRKYVGKAISQAVVRASDREHFHSMFEKFGFSGNENISATEMEHYLSHWMLGAGPNPRLRRVWQIPDLRERVAEAAVAELSIWSVTNSPAGGTGGTRAARLSLFASLSRRLGGQRLELHLGRVAEGMDVGPLKLSGSANHFRIANNDFGGIATINPPAIGNLGEGLGHVFEFEDTSRRTSGFEWQPRLVIPLAMHPQANVWTESPRVTFGVPHLVLVRDARNMPAQVESYLANVCTSAPRCAEASQLKGLPPGWVLYEDVQIRKIAEPPHEALDCLVPFGEESFFTISGGIQLMPSFYHSGVKPVAIYIAKAGPTTIDATIEDEVDSGVHFSTRSETAECSFELDPAKFPKEGNIFLSARQRDGNATKKQVFFRDANLPHPLNLDQKGRLAYRSITSAKPFDATSSLSVEGYVVDGEVPFSMETGEFQSVSLIEGSSEDFQGHAPALRMHGTAQTCIERGYHHTKYQTVPPNSPPGTLVEGECLGCNRRDIIIFRRPQAAVKTREFVRFNLPRISEEVAANDVHIDYELLFDALCFLGSGSWAKFQSLVDSWGEGTRPPRQVAHDLFLLGLIDIDLRQGTNTIRAWSVPAPSLHFIDGQKAYFSGFRCRSLVTEIKLAVAGSGARFNVEECAGRPPILWLEGITIEQAAKIFEGIVDPIGRRVSLHTGTSLTLARACAALDGMEAATTPVSIGEPKNLQWFDLQKVRWNDVDHVRKSGAYRWNDGMQAYAYVQPDGTGVMGPYQIIKLLAAREQGIMLHMHEQASQAFLSTLGCEPAGLLERALVACSGRLPKIGKGMTAYANVDVATAFQILKQLYPERISHEARQSHQRH
jgi:hypothetical protein